MMARWGRVLATAICLAMRLTNRKVGIALLYHRIDVIQGDPQRELVPALGARLFEEQVRHLLRAYRIVRASQLPEAVRQRSRGQRFPVAITFDDDDSRYTRVALPILRRHGATATFYLSGASLDDPFRFWFEQLQDLADSGRLSVEDLGLSGRVPNGAPALVHRVSETVQRLAPVERERVVGRIRDVAGPPDAGSGMPRADVEELAAAPVEIGFHTRRHEPLATLNADEVRRELAEGRDELEALVGRRLVTIAYPYGSTSPAVAAAAREAGYTTGFTVVPRAVRPNDDPLLLGRLSPSFDSVGHFALQLARRLCPRP